MTLHYHGTPITPTRFLLEDMAGAHFCVSHAQPQQIRQCHEVGQSVMIDNGAFTAWTQGQPITDWQPYYTFCDIWLDHPTTWAVIPDDITGDVEAQRRLEKQWPHGWRGAPVWHMHEDLFRLLDLLDQWPRVCIGSSAEYRVVGSVAWERRMDQAWREIDRRHRRTPWVHMLRGLQLVGERWPFASVDSTDIARNHSAKQNTPAKMRRRWDPVQNPARFVCRGEQLEIL